MTRIRAEQASVLGTGLGSNGKWKRLGRVLSAILPSRAAPDAPDGWQDTPALFVLSTGRAGTDTLSALMGLSPGICAHHEPRPKLTSERKAAFLEVREQPAIYERIFREARGAMIGAAMLEGRAYAETSARLTFFAPVIHRLMPRAVFVHLHRHPADIVRSGMRRGWYATHKDDRHRILPDPKSDAGRSWSDWDRFTRICWYWSAYHRFALDWLDEVGSDRAFDLPSKDLFAGNSQAISVLFSRLSCAPPEPAQVQACLGERLNAQVRGEFPVYADWSDEQKATLAAHCGEIALRLGYQLDGWTTASPQASAGGNRP